MRSPVPLNDVGGGLPILARCKKCGRGFVTEPQEYPAFDPYLPPGTRRLDTEEPCGGEIEPLRDQ